MDGKEIAIEPARLKFPSPAPVQHKFRVNQRVQLKRRKAEKGTVVEIWPHGAEYQVRWDSGPRLPSNEAYLEVADE